VTMLGRIFRSLMDAKKVGLASRATSSKMAQSGRPGMI
jgi:hypothetical protein